MQRSTDGTPAALLRRAPEWHYWQAIWYEPAWITWLKKIGCSGPWRVVEERLREAAKHGFKLAVVPEANVPKRPPEGMTVRGVTRLNQALEAF